jgi:hypothetical protein
VHLIEYPKKYLSTSASTKGPEKKKEFRDEQNEWNREKNFKLVAMLRFLLSALSCVASGLLKNSLPYFYSVSVCAPLVVVVSR